MIAEEQAEYIREKLKQSWPGLNGCDALECLIDRPELLYYEDFKAPAMIVKKLNIWQKFFNKLRGIFCGKSH